MEAVQLEAWHLAETLSVANGAELSSFVGALFVKTGQTLCFIFEASTRMPTLLNFCTTVIYHFLTVIFITNIQQILPNFNLFLTNSTFNCILVLFLLITSSSHMIWLNTTFHAEILITFTSNTELSHMVS